MRALRVRSRGLRLFSAILVALSVLTTISLGVTPDAQAATPDPNPDLSATCGLDVMFILDESNSIRRSGATDEVQDAMSAFLAALNGTGSRLTLVEFNDVARVVFPTPVEINQTNIDSVFNPYLFGGGYAPSGTTNWHDAFLKAQTLPPADVYILLSDGSPNRFVASETAELTPIDAAIEASNVIKAGGPHIFAVGVGSAGTNLTTQTNLIAVSGPDEWVITDPGRDLHTADYTLVNSFNQLATAMQELAIDLCGGSITVRKQVVPAGGGAPVPAAGWAFNSSPVPAETSPADGMTDSRGILNMTFGFDVPTTVDLTEVVRPGHTFDSVVCTNTLGADPVVTPIANGAQFDLGPLDAMVCTFTNTENEGDPLVVMKEAAPQTLPETGGIFTYTLDVTNPATNDDPISVTGVTDTVAGALPIDACDAGNFPFVLAVGSSTECTFTIDHQGNAGDAFANTATAHAADPAFDGTSNEETVELTNLPSGITVTKTANPTSVPESGGDVVFTVGVLNDSAVDEVTLTNITDIDSGFITVADTALGSDIPDDTTCDELLGAGGLVLAAGAASVSCEFTLFVSGDFGTDRVDEASVTGTDDDGNPVGDSALATVSFTDVPSSIAVIKTPVPGSVTEAGGVVSYEVEIENTSVTDVVTINDIVDSQFGVVASTSDPADVDPADTDCDELLPTVLNPDDVASCSFDGLVPAGAAGTSHDNTVTVSGTDDDGGDVSNTADASVPRQDVPATITVDKSANPTSVVEPGADVEFTVTIENTSPANTVFIKDIVDDQFGVVASTTQAPDIDPGDTTCDTLLAGGGLVLAQGAPAVSCTFAAFVAGQPGDLHENTVTASGQANDLQPVSDDGTAQVTVTNVAATLDVLKIAQPQVVLEPGGDVQFTIFIQNTSDVDDITITDIVDEVGGVISVVASTTAAADIDPADTTCDELLGGTGLVLPPGDVQSCTFTDFIEGVNGDTFTDTVTGSGVDDDGFPVEDSDDETVSITDTVGNPDLPTACGIDVIFVLDESGSIARTPGAEQQVRESFLAFIDALNNTGSRMAVVEFNDTGRIVIGTFTEINDTNITTVFEPYINGAGYNPSGTTNWDNALNKANILNGQHVAATGFPVDIVFMVTDGAPNRTDDPAFTPLEAAVQEANLIKVAGTKMFGVGVGSAGTSPGNELNLIEVTGPDKYPDGLPGLNTDDYALVGNFADLPDALRDFATRECFGEVHLTKLFDDDSGNPPAPVEDWEFTIDVGDPTIVVVVDPADSKTRADGTIDFEWLSSSGRDVTVFETLGIGEELRSFTCTSTDDKGVVEPLPVTTGPASGMFFVGPDRVVDCVVTNGEFFVPQPGFVVVKKTEGIDAPDPGAGDAPEVSPGDPVTWTYTVTNTGNVPIEDVVVTDSVLGAIAGPDSGDTNGNTLLDITEVWEYSFSGFAEDLVLGDPHVVPGVCGAELRDPWPLYENTAEVTGTYLGVPITITTDISHYCNPPDPSLDVQKLTEAAHADSADGVDVPQIAPGGPVQWTYVVTNTGDVPISNVVVTDTVVGVVPGPASGDLAPFGVLDLTETWTYIANGTAEDLLLSTHTVPGTCGIVGLDDYPVYENRGDATGTYLGLPYDAAGDLSHYCNPPDPSFEVEKTTNGVSASDPAAGDAPELAPGDPVEWVYTVTNTGNVPVAGVMVTDSVIGLVVGPDSGDSAPFGILDVGEVWVYVANGFAEDIALGGPHIVTGVCGATQRDPWPLYENQGLVTGSFLGVPVPVATDLSHYCNPPDPSLDVQKLTNGSAADSADGLDVPQIAPGDPVQWTYVVTNTGDVAISDVVVTDSVIGPVSGPDSGDDGNGVLDVGEVWTYIANGTAEDLLLSAHTVPGTCGIVGLDDYPVYENRGDATGTYLGLPYDALGDLSHYCNPPDPSYEVDKTTNGVSASDPAAGDAPELLPGAPVTWTYTVTNTGNVPVTGVAVNDSVIGPVPGPASGDLVPLGVLDIGEVWVYTANGTAQDLAFGPPHVVPGVCGAELRDPWPLYENQGLVSGFFLGDPVAVATDLSHYCNPPGPSLDVQKFTNGSSADFPNGADVPKIAPGAAVQWVYVVTNTGDVPLSNVVVTDSVTGVVPGPPSGDFAPFGQLGLTETWTYVVDGTAEDLLLSTHTVPGTCGIQGLDDYPIYENRGDATGTYLGLPYNAPGDLSHYCNPPAPSFDVEKATNGVSASNPASGDAPEIAPGDAVTWTYTVTNTGNVPVTGIAVIDTVIGPVPGPASGDAPPLGVLDVGEAWVYVAGGTAQDLALGNPNVVPGVCGAELRAPWPLYENRGLVSGSFLGAPVAVASDLSHYCNPPEPSFDIQKLTNGLDADSPNGVVPLVGAGDPVQWRYIVTNTGDVAITNVVVTDSVRGPIPGPTSGDFVPLGVLDVGETWFYLANGFAEDLDTSPNTVPGSCGLDPEYSVPVYENRGVATGEYLTVPIASSEDLSHYCNPPVPTIDVLKTPSVPQVLETGENVTFTVEVKNTFQVGVQLFDLNDDVFGDIANAGNPAILSTTCVLPQPLAGSGLAGDTYTCEFEAFIFGPSGTSHTDTVTAKAQRFGVIAEADDDATVLFNDDPVIYVSLEKDAVPLTAPEPGTFDFTLTIQNLNNEDYEVVSLTDDNWADPFVPEGTCGALIGQTLVALGSLDCTYPITHPLVGTYPNNATVTIKDDDGNFGGDFANAEVEVTDVLPIVQLFKDATAPTVRPEPGGDFEFTLVIDNDSVEPVTITVLADTNAPDSPDFAANCDFVGTVLAADDGLAGGEDEVSCTYTVPHSQPGVYDNFAEVVVSDDDGNTDNDEDDATVEVTNVGPQPLRVEKDTSTPTLPELGGTFSFTTLITNPSAVDTATINAIGDDWAANQAPLDVGGQDLATACVTEPGGVAVVLPHDLAPGDAILCSFTEDHFGNALDSWTDEVSVDAVDDDGDDVSQVSNPVTVSLTDVPALPLEIEKTTSTPTLPELGGTFSFTAVITNPSLVDTARIVNIVDNWIAEPPLFGGGGGNIATTCVDSGGVPIGPLPHDLAPGDFLTCDFTEDHFGNAGDEWTDKVTAAATDDDGADVSATSNPVTVGLTNVGPQPLEILKATSTPTLPEPGGTFDFTAQITNPSAVDTAKITAITDDWAGDAPLVDSGSQDLATFCETSPGAVPVVLPHDLAPGDSILCSFSQDHFGNALDSWTDEVTADATDDDGEDVSATSNPVTVSLTDVGLQPLRIVKAATTPTLPEPGGTFDFTAVITNPSAVDTAKITAITDDWAGDAPLVDSGSQDLATSCETVPGGVAVVLPHDLAPGDSILCTFSQDHFGNALDSWTDEVTADAVDDDGDDVSATSNPVTVGLTNVGPQPLRIVKATTTPTLPEPGGTFDFTALITNPSAVDTAKITAITDDWAGDAPLVDSGSQDLATSCETVPGGVAVVLPHDLAPGDSILCTFSQDHFGNALDSWTDEVTADAVDDDGDDVSATSNPVTVSLTDVDPQPLRIVKATTTPTLPEPGGTFDFTALITNPSAVDTAKITAITDDWAGDAPLVDSGSQDLATSCETVPGGVAVVLPHDLAPGDSILCTFSQDHLGNALDSWTDEVTADAVDDDGDDVSATSNPVTVSLTDVDPQPLLIVKATTTPTLPEPGGTFDFTALITNPSAVDTAKITAITDEWAGDAPLVESGSKDLATSCETVPGGVAVVLPHDLAPGDSILCTFSQDHLGNALDSWTDAVTADAVDDDGDDVSTTSNDVTVSLTNVGPQPLRVEKATTTPTLPEPGGTFDFTTLITNPSAVDTATITGIGDAWGADQAPFDTGGQDLATLCETVPGAVAVVLPHDLAPGDSILCTFTEDHFGNAGDSWTDRVSVIGVDDDGDDVSATSNEVTVELENVQAVPLRIVKATSTPTLPEPGGTFDFTAVITNPSVVDTATITGISDAWGADQAPFGTGGQDLATLCETVPGAVAVVLPHDLAPGDSILCTFTEDHFGDALDSWTDAVTADAVDDDGDDVSATSNPVTVSLTDEPAVPLDVVKSTSTPFLGVPGGTFSFMAVITNPSAVDTATITAIGDDWAANQAPFDIGGQDLATSCADTSGLAVALPHDLAPGDSITCSFATDHFGVAGDMWTDQVSVDAFDDDGANVSTVSNEVTVGIAGITVEKLNDANMDGVFSDPEELPFPGAPLSQDDYSSFIFHFDDGTQVMGSTAPGAPERVSNNEADLNVLVPGSPWDDTFHVSCSDEFNWGSSDEGLGEKGAPDPGEPRVVFYTIAKWKDGEIDKMCGLDKPVTFKVNITADGADFTIDSIMDDVFGTDGDLTTPFSGLPSCADAVGNTVIPDGTTITCYFDGAVGGNEFSIPGNDDTYQFEFVFEHADGTTTTVQDSSNGNEPFVAGAGGLDPDNPSGLVLHVSCSDEFGFTDGDPSNDGWGERKDPDEVDDAEWRVQSYRITKFNSDGTVNKTCGNGEPGPHVNTVTVWASNNGFDAHDDDTSTITFPEPPPVCDLCESGNPTALVFTYVEGACDESANTQGDKSECTGGPASGLVYILATDKSDPSDGGAKVWFEGWVSNDQTFTISAANGGASSFSSTTYVHILDGPGGTSIQRNEVHTSCSAPLVEGDVFGALLLGDAMDPDSCAFDHPFFEESLVPLLIDLGLDRDPFATTNPVPVVAPVVAIAAAAAAATAVAVATSSPVPFSVPVRDLGVMLSVAMLAMWLLAADPKKRDQTVFA